MGVGGSGRLMEELGIIELDEFGDEIGDDVVDCNGRIAIPPENLCRGPPIATEVVEDKFPTIPDACGCVCFANLCSGRKVKELCERRVYRTVRTLSATVSSV